MFTDPVYKSFNDEKNDFLFSGFSEKITPQEVRDILNADNKQIVSLCKKNNLTPKKDPNGKLYFSKDDVKLLKRVSMSYEKSKANFELENEGNSLNAPEMPSGRTSIVDVPLRSTQPASLDELLVSMSQLESKMEQKMTAILEEKLDGMDDVVMELIDTKVEVENLRAKINELNCENFALKNTLKEYKSVGFGLYVKSSQNGLLGE